MRPGNRSQVKVQFRPSGEITFDPLRQMELDAIRRTNARGGASSTGDGQPPSEAPPQTKTITLRNLPPRSLVSDPETMNLFTVNGTSVVVPSSLSRLLLVYPNGVRRAISLPTQSGDIDASAKINIKVSSVVPYSRFKIGDTDFSGQATVDGVPGGYINDGRDYAISVTTDGQSMPDLSIVFPARDGLPETTETRRLTWNPENAPSQPIEVSGARGAVQQPESEPIDTEQHPLDTAPPTIQTSQDETAKLIEEIEKQQRRTKYLLGGLAVAGLVGVTWYLSSSTPEKKSNPGKRKKKP